MLVAVLAVLVLVGVVDFPFCAVVVVFAALVAAVSAVTTEQCWRQFAWSWS